MSAEIMRRRMLMGLLASAVVPFVTTARAACKAAAVANGAKLILVDNTTAIASDAAAQLVARLAAWPAGGERLVVASFGGKRGDLLRIHLDEQIDPLTLPPRLVANMPVRDHKAYVACAKAADASVRAELTDVLARELAHREPAASGNTSPIIDALLSAATIFEDLRAGGGMVVISDGILHEGGSGATSFYATGEQDRVKHLDVAAMLASLQRQHRVPQLQRVRVWHAGLGGVANDGNGARSPAEMAVLREFWTRFWDLAGADFRGAGHPVPLRPFD